jgi:hypothetical protein
LTTSVTTVCASRMGAGVGPVGEIPQAYSSRSLATRVFASNSASTHRLTSGVSGLNFEEPMATPPPSGYGIVAKSLKLARRPSCCAPVRNSAHSSQSELQRRAARSQQSLLSRLSPLAKRCPSRCTGWRLPRKGPPPHHPRGRKRQPKDPSHKRWAETVRRLSDRVPRHG